MNANKLLQTTTLVIQNTKEGGVELIKRKSEEPEEIPHPTSYLI